MPNSFCTCTLTHLLTHLLTRFCLLPSAGGGVFHLGAAIRLVEGRSSGSGGGSGGSSGHVFPGPGMAEFRAAGGAGGGGPPAGVTPRRPLQQEEESIRLLVAVDYI